MVASIHMPRRRPRMPIRFPSFRQLVNLALAVFILVALFHSLKRNVIEDDRSLVEAQHVDMLVANSMAQQLDDRYLSRLIAEAGNGNSEYRAQLSDRGPESSKHSATIVMGRLEDEPDRVHWAYNPILNLDRTEIYIVDNPNISLPHLVQNHGREAAVYFTYIIANYDKLSDVTFFWHSDEIVWHNNLLMDWNSTITLSRMDRDNIIREGYVPSRCDQWPGCPSWIRFDPSRAEHRLDPHRLEELFNPKVLSEIFPLAKEFPPFFAGTCCSQFAVSRDTIHQHPVETYEHILEWVANADNDDAYSGRMLEYLWPYIFLGRGTHCPTMENCYCKTYNFCMKSANDIAKLERWNGLRTRREEFQWQLKFVQDALEAAQKAAEAHGATPEELLEVEQAFRPEMDRLTESLATFTTSTWLAREEIIHYWKLGIPPVGW